MTAAIRTHGLTKHYGDFEALVELDLTVKAGEIFGFLGPNGAGKTTTIRLLLDEIRPTAGHATIVGLDCRDDAVAIRRHIGYLPGDLSMYPNLTGRDTLRYFANLRGGVDWSYVDALAERLDADLDREVGQLSTGNRQKVGLVQAFMNRPEVVIMDEPSSGLDPLVQREFQTLIRDVAAEGTTVFLSSHTLSEVPTRRPPGGHHPARTAHRGRRHRQPARQVHPPRRSRPRRSGRPDRTSPPWKGSGTSLSTATTSPSPSTGRWRRCSGRRPPETLVDIPTQEADLEEIFLTYYRDDEAS